MSTKINQCTVRRPANMSYAKPEVTAEKKTSTVDNEPTVPEQTSVNKNPKNTQLNTNKSSYTAKSSASNKVRTKIDQHMGPMLPKQAYIALGSTIQIAPSETKKLGHVPSKGEQLLKKMGLKNGAKLLSVLPGLTDALQTVLKGPTASLSLQDPGEMFRSLSDLFGHQKNTKLQNQISLVNTAIRLDSALNCIRDSGAKLSFADEQKLISLAKQQTLNQLFHPQNPLSSIQKQTVLAHYLRASYDQLTQMKKVFDSYNFTQKADRDKFKKNGLQELLKKTKPKLPNAIDVAKKVTLDPIDKLLKDKAVSTMLSKLGLPGLDKKTLASIQSKAGKVKDVTELAQDLTKAAEAFKKGHYIQGTGHVICSLGSFQSLLGESKAGKLIEANAKRLFMIPFRALKKGDKATTDAIGRLFDLAFKAGTLPNMIKIAGNLLRGNVRELFKEIGDMTNTIAFNSNLTASEKANGVKDMLFALSSFLPDEQKKKFLGKVLTRKIPVLNFLLAAYDISQTGYAGFHCALGSEKSCKDLKKNALDSASSIAGVFPGLGTAASVGIDMIQLGMLIHKNYDVLKKQFKDPSKMLENFLKNS